MPNIAEIPNAKANEANFPAADGAVATRSIPAGIEMKKQ
tara:strand:- start:424 stop:540 length:117 start_codon:yes stop_codon:yes gene_type:complete